MFENRVLRKIFGHKMEEVVGGWRRLHNVELHNLYTSPHVKGDHTKQDEMGGTCSTYGRNEKCIRYHGWKSSREDTTRKA
jgi:hypothetical protein